MGLAIPELLATMLLALGGEQLLKRVTFRGGTAYVAVPPLAAVVLWIFLLFKEVP